YLTALRSGGGSGTNWYDSLWTIGYVLVGVAALHPSMADVGRHAGADDARFDRARVALIGSALFVAPVLVLVGSAGGSDVSPVVIAVSMTVVVAVVVWRLASLARVARASSERATLPLTRPARGRRDRRARSRRDGHVREPRDRGHPRHPGRAARRYRRR